MKMLVIWRGFGGNVLKLVKYCKKEVLCAQG